MGDRREQIERGSQARAVLDNPAFVEAVRTLEDRYIREWATSEPGEIDKREDAHRALRALGALTDELTILLDNGEVAARQIEIEEQRNGR